MHIKKDDIVQIISGDDRGKQGRVLKVFPESNRIIVEGVNFIKRHTRPNPKIPQGGIVEREAPIHASNALVVCPKCNQITTTGMKKVSDEMRKRVTRVRFCKKCGEMILEKSS